MGTKYRERFMNYMENIIVHDNAYFGELELKNKRLEKQTMYVWPPKHMVDATMQSMAAKKKMSCDVISPPPSTLLPADLTPAPYDLDDINDTGVTQRRWTTQQEKQETEYTDPVGSLLLESNIGIELIKAP